MDIFDSNMFCERAIELFGDIGQMELAQKIGISQGVISAIKNKKIKAPGADTVFKISKYFNVSADYLLGLSNVLSLDLDTQEICKKIGISESMLESLTVISDYCCEMNVLKDDSDMMKDVFEALICSLSSMVDINATGTNNFLICLENYVIAKDSIDFFSTRQLEFQKNISNICESDFEMMNSTAVNLCYAQTDLDAEEWRLQKSLFLLAELIAKKWINKRKGAE